MMETSTTQWATSEPGGPDRGAIIEALGKATNAEILDEVEYRGLEDDIIAEERCILYGEAVDANREAILDALIMLKTGRIDDGIAALECEFFPRYADEAECRAAYVRAMGLESGGTG